jgi:hypothetical protein
MPACVGPPSECALLEKPAPRVQPTVSCAAQQLGTQQAIPVTSLDMAKFEERDALFPGKLSINAEEVLALDGAKCTPKTRDGILSLGGASCYDIGSTAANVDDMMWPLVWHPKPAAATQSPAAVALGQKMREALVQNQFSPAGCARSAEEQWRSLYYVQTVPLVGFASDLEYLSMFLARAVHMRSQLLLGPRSSVGWTSRWFCGDDRSLRCYFNISSCCAVVTLHGEGLELPRRRNPLNMGLPGYNAYGSAWVSAQLAGFLFGQMNGPTRKYVDQRRAALRPVVSPPHLPVGDPRHVPTIGMHVRGGDSCHARRFCPSNLTATFFEQAAELRRRYGANRLLLATDSKEAARLCAARVLGFECVTMPMRREKFESATFIEQRVETHDEGELSGATVALDALTDLDMLADCDYFVLLFRSAMSRVAYALSLARKGYHVPLVSMQWPWSPGYLKGKAMKGKKGGRRPFVKGRMMSRGGLSKAQMKARLDAWRGRGGKRRGGGGRGAERRLAQHP